MATSRPLTTTDNASHVNFSIVPDLFDSKNRFINEGNFFEGGHGDFKQDETTSLYWSVIKHKLDDSAYDK